MTKKMTEAEWWQEPASAAACKILGLAEGTSQFECFMHALERIAEVKTEAATGEPVVVVSRSGGYDGGAVMAAVAMLKLRMHCDADRELLCGTVEGMRKSGMIPPEQELRADERHAVEEFGDKIKHICAVADEQRAREPDDEPEPPKRLN